MNSNPDADVKKLCESGSFGAYFLFSPLVQQPLTLMFTLKIK